MTNADKYLKDGVKDEFIKEVNSEMDLYGGQFNVEQFLSLEVKPTLTEDEKVILRNALESGADAILRNDGGIYFHTKPGTKGIFGNIFQFTKQRRRI